MVREQRWIDFPKIAQLIIEETLLWPGHSRKIVVRGSDDLCFILAWSLLSCVSLKKLLRLSISTSASLSWVRNNLCLVLVRDICKHFCKRRAMYVNPWITIALLPALVLWFQCSPRSPRPPWTSPSVLEPWHAWSVLPWDTQPHR
jgi:hypothetical protein